MWEYRIPAFISLQKYLMRGEGPTGVNEKTRNRDGTWSTAIAVSPFSDPRQSPLMSHGTLNSTRLDPGFRNLILVLRVATIGQVGLDLEMKYICNIWFKRKINSEKKESGNIRFILRVCQCLWNLGVKNRLGSSNLFGSLTPLMVSVSGRLIKILKVKS